MKSIHDYCWLTTAVMIIWITDSTFGDESVSNCGGSLVATSEDQILSSPNYPLPYENNVICTWIITPEIEGEQIEIHIDAIDTEACCDAIDVKDGLSPEAKKIANLRGNYSVEKFATAFGGLQITFSSDESVVRRGFIIRYKLVEALSNPVQTLPATNISDILVSPSWPLSYPSNSMYTWVIEAEPNSHAGLTILYLRTETCCDGLTIRNGHSESSPLLDDLRGEQMGLLYSSLRGGALSLRFYTDGANNDWGFLLSYFSLTEELFDDPQSLQTKAAECQEKVINFTEGFGMITPPGFPGTYPSHLQCSWIINAPEHYKVRIWFSYVHTEACCDWIKVRDGKDHKWDKIALISGNSSNFYNSVSTNNTMRLEFDTDSKTNSRGFVAYYEAVREDDSLATTCGGEIDVGSELQYISSPGWPEPYNQTSECVWHVRADPSMKIRLIMLGFITKPAHYNILAFDGPNTESVALLDLNSNVYEPLVVSTTTSWLTLSFIILSADKAEYGGFRAAIVAYDEN